MTFPVSPTNGQKANVNGVTYTYNSTLTAWTVSSNFLDGISANLVAANSVTSVTTVVAGTTFNATGNVTGGNVVTTGLITATGNIRGGNLVAVATVSATSVLSSTVSASGNVIGGNVVTTGLITATGNIRGGNLVAVATVSATSVLSSTVSASGNVIGGNVVTTGLITATGSITTAGQVTATSNITGGNISTAGLITATGNITGGNVSTSGSITSAALVLNNGSADGGGLVLKSLGFTDWEIDNSDGVTRFFQPGVTYMQLATTGLSVTGNITSTNNLNGFVRPSAGTTTAAPVLLAAGTNLTTPAAGALEFADGVIYATEATTPGRGEVGVFQQFRYTSAGSALGPTIADYFGATSSINLAANSIYEIEARAYFLKTTAGTATFTWTFSSAVDVAHSWYVGTAAAGFNTTAVTTAPVTGQVVQRTTTAMAHAATGSLTSAVYHSYRFKVLVETSLATNARLRITQSAGTATPQPGSYYSVRQISANTGNFAA